MKRIDHNNDCLEGSVETYQGKDGKKSETNTTGGKKKKREIDESDMDNEGADAKLHSKGKKMTADPDNDVGKGQSQIRRSPGDAARSNTVNDTTDRDQLQDDGGHEESQPLKKGPPQPDLQAKIVRHVEHSISLDVDSDEAMTACTPEELAKEREREMQGGTRCCAEDVSTIIQITAGGLSTGV